MSKIETWFDKWGKDLKWENLIEYKRLIEELPSGRYIVTIEKVFNNRSREQNNSIWAIPYKYFKQALINSGEFVNPSKQQIHEWAMLV